MPNWLKAYIALGTSCIIVLAIFGSILVMAALTRQGEDPFTPTQKMDLAENAQGGTYISPSLYRYCGNDAIFWYVDSQRRLWTNNERCAAWIHGR